MDVIRPGDTMHGVEEDLEVPMCVQKCADRIKVEDVLVGRHVNEFNFQLSISLNSNHGKIDVGQFGNLVGGQ
jgi:hypothetical protein